MTTGDDGDFHAVFSPEFLLDTEICLNSSDFILAARQTVGRNRSLVLTALAGNRGSSPV